LRGVHLNIKHCGGGHVVDYLVDAGLGGDHLRSAGIVLRAMLIATLIRIPLRQ